MTKLLLKAALALGLLLPGIAAVKLVKENSGTIAQEPVKILGPHPATHFTVPLVRHSGKAALLPKPAAVNINTDSLKSSNWYSTVMADLKHKSYYITTRMRAPTA